MVNRKSSNGFFHSRFTIYHLRFFCYAPLRFHYCQKPMPERSATSRPVHENLDTAYINLAALLGYLRQREFAGRIHVELDEYDADVFLNADEPPHVRETD